MIPPLEALSADARTTEPLPRRRIQAKREYSDALARAAERTAWLRAPGRAGLLLGNRTTSLTRSLRVSNAKFCDATGWTPHHRNANDGWIATAAALARRP